MRPIFHLLSHHQPRCLYCRVIYADLGGRETYTWYIVFAWLIFELALVQGR